jgi:hypothetical protein
MLWRSVDPAGAWHGLQPAGQDRARESLSNATNIAGLLDDLDRLAVLMQLNDPFRDVEDPADLPGRIRPSPLQGGAGSTEGRHARLLGLSHSM